MRQTKTNHMRRIECKFGQPLEDLIPAVYDEVGTLRKVAAHLGIDYTCLWGWMKRLGIKITTSRTVIRIN